MTRPHDQPRFALVIGPWAVVAQRQEVMFRDGTAVHLHPVVRVGVPDTFLRALRHGDGWLVTDLRYHGTEIEADILRLQARDTPGVVFFTLRAAYATAQAFVAHAAAQPVVRLVAPAQACMAVAA